MPQVYRRHSEYTQRPLIEPRRRPSLAPQPTDADNSIVLSDVVRAGESSRLRRRGAMRLDHGLSSAARTPLPGNMPPIVPASSSTTASARPAVFAPPRTPTPPWVAADPAGEEEYTYSGEEWREWTGDDRRAEGSGGGMQLDELGRESAQEVEERSFILFCGGEERDSSEPLGSSGGAFQPSPFPVPPPTRASSTRGIGTERRTNGCGAIVHMHALPQRPRGVWVGKEEATEVVVGLDAEYFERSIIAKMMKSACGCIREGIGCAACGNTLGTRYLPCQAASEGIFSRSSSGAPRTSRPLQPSGPHYWRSHPSAPHAPLSASSFTRSASFYVYTFFADHVSSAPAYSFPELPKRLSPPADIQVRIESRPASPVTPTYGFRLTASPRPFSPYPTLPPSASSTSAFDLPFYAPPPSATPLRSVLPPRMPLSQTPRLGLDIPSPRASPGADAGLTSPPAGVDADTAMGMGMELDADGMVVDGAEDPSSPDKTGNEGMLWPGR
ncbi:hypothetical protein AcV5_001481 [Taiwanofungus camphoratus]|nr:hypothetical protein AcV5_001481 [Antrodia cinnamomea]